MTEESEQRIKRILEEMQLSTVINNERDTKETGRDKKPRKRLNDDEKPNTSVRLTKGSRKHR